MVNRSDELASAAVLACEREGLCGEVLTRCYDWASADQGPEGCQ